MNRVARVSALYLRSLTVTVALQTKTSFVKAAPDPVTDLVGRPE
jgi:hypothetical protein